LAAVKPVDDLFVGRDSERAALESLAAQAGAGRGAIVLVTGEAGVGKSMLVRTVLGDSAPEVFEGLGVPDGASAYGPVVEALRSMLARRDAAALIEPSLRSQLAVILPELGRPAPAVDRATVLEAIRSLLVQAAAQRPLALLLDDLQWADRATLDLLPALARSLAAAPVLLVGIYRSDEIPRGHPVRRLRTELRRDRRLLEITVPPLDGPATAELLEHVLGAAAAPSLREAIFDRTDGVPFFVTELALALSGGDRLRKGEAGLELSEGADLPLPDGVRDAVLLRASGLSDDARAVVAVATVAGQSFDPDSVMAIAGLDEWPDEPLRHGFVVEGPAGQMAFRHALVRDAFYGEIPWLRRRSLHRQVAELLEASGAPAPIVAEHWSQAREDERARRCHLAAADDFCAVHAYHDGARAARRALELWADGDDEPGRLDALELLARCAELAAEPAEAVRAWRDVVEGRRREGDPLRIGEAARRLAGALEVQGRWEEALSTREHAAVAFGSAGAAGEAASERLAAAAHLRSAASFRAALELLELAREDAVTAGRVDLQARILGLEGNVRARMGESAPGLELVRSALTMALDANLTTAAAEIYQRLADSLEHAGDYAAARATYDDASAFCTAGGLEPTAQLCLACLAVVLRQGGDWDRAVTICRDVLASPDATAHARAAAAMTLGSILALRGEAPPARALLHEALSTARRIELVPVEMLAGWGLALLEDSRDAGERCRWILERWRQSEDRHYAIAPLRWAATFLAGQGDDAGARACAAALAEIAADAGQPEAVSALAHALGETALLDGEAGQAALQFERAVDLLHGVGGSFERMETERRAAAALIAADRREEAVERLFSAYRIARRLRARPSVRSLAASLAELGEPADRRLSRRQAEQLGNHDLTRREVDVLRLVAVGNTNREIADELFVSPRTVDMHVRNLLRKLDCRSRADAARRASELGLLGDTVAPKR
jgi:DNA-binding CsgD family transcriptional regulator/type II secretory pathway predicted ATPase ExeA